MSDQVKKPKATGLRADKRVARANALWRVIEQLHGFTNLEQRSILEAAAVFYNIAVQVSSNE